MVTVLGTKLDVSHFIELDNFSDVQYEHFIRLYIDAAKAKDVRFTIRQPIDKNSSNMCLFQTEIFEWIKLTMWIVVRFSELLMI